MIQVELQNDGWYLTLRNLFFLTQGALSKLEITEKKGDKNDKLITFISCKNLHYMPNVHSVFIISTENFVTMLHTPIKQNIHGSMKLQIDILIIDAELSII